MTQLCGILASLKRTRTMNAHGKRNWHMNEYRHVDGLAFTGEEGWNEWILYGNCTFHTRKITVQTANNDSLLVTSSLQNCIRRTRERCHIAVAVKTSKSLQLRREKFIHVQRKCYLICHERLLYGKALNKIQHKVIKRVFYPSFHNIRHAIYMYSTQKCRGLSGKTTKY